MENSNNFGRINSNLYSRAKINKDTERPNIANRRIIKNFQNPLNEIKENNEISIGNSITDKNKNFIESQLKEENKNFTLPLINQSNISIINKLNLNKENSKVIKKNSNFNPLIGDKNQLNNYTPQIQPSSAKSSNIQNGQKQSPQLSDYNNNTSTSTKTTSITINHKYPAPSKKIIQMKKNNINPKKKSEYLKENILKLIEFFMDPLTLKNFMLTCKKFYKTVCENDELWYYYYIKRFIGNNNPSKNIKTNTTIKSKKISSTPHIQSKYEENRGKWRNVFITSMMSIFKTNYNSLKTKFMQKFSKNSYANIKDPYYMSNNLYSFLKPLYYLELDGKIFPVKHVFSNKILSHINFFANFDQEFIDMNKIKNIKLLLTEKNLGLVNIRIANYEIKKRKFEEFEGNTSKICKIYYDHEIVISTFEKNLIFFFNISMAICKICEKIFDFVNGIHGKNLDYFDDVDSKFGLYDYTMLINIKSWNQIFYTVNVNTLDFKQEDEFLFYEFNGESK
jgi:hypothetical protein